ncbi:HNH endonuclease [Tenacibaculum phage PTm1]|uniref:Uncharacterized protein n=2 Tax=Shirahamavirus PTm1 TaxID=2846435 RepID=A0A5S9ERL9_9CAUD|nr:HNH endonuclease [Tenacibaculum phage PTm1]BBI90486.1 hypothetical protein [Tenacibaculum phage PTm1]BBI90794.1 hypothetical protein [Tenacibaculum phage PTm5]
MKNDFIIDRVGERYYTNQGYEIEIIRYNGYYDISVKFLSSGHVVETTYTSIKNGTIKNLLHKTVKGVGCFGYGEYKSRNKIYDTWFHILTRCYCEKTHIKQQHILDVVLMIIGTIIKNLLNGWM